MWKCPVCKKDNDTMQCSGCGFDGSCDLERYPSLGELTSPMDSVSGRRALRQEAQKNDLLCPNCGGSQFTVELGSMAYICDGCGQRLAAESVKKPEPIPDKTNQAAPSGKPAKRKLGEREEMVFLYSAIALIWQGILIFMHRMDELYLMDAETKGIGASVFWMLMIFVTVFALVRLWKKGFGQTHDGKCGKVLCRILNTGIGALGFLLGETLILYRLCRLFQRESELWWMDLFCAFATAGVHSLWVYAKFDCNAAWEKIKK